MERDEEAPWDQTLSGGEKQRLAFARIFLHNPDIIVLDEATAALDPNSQDKLMELLSKEPSETTLVSVGHRPELEAFHSRKIVLERRRKGAKLVSDIRLVRKPGRKFIRRFMRKRPVKAQAGKRASASYIVRDPRVVMRELDPRIPLREARHCSPKRDGRDDPRRLKRLARP
jgi:putative ATP-binding cassette transporter